MKYGCLYPNNPAGAANQRITDAFSTPGRRAEPRDDGDDRTPTV